MAFDISQIDSIVTDLKAAPKAVRAKAKVAIKKTALDIERHAKTVVPVDTGNLKNSIGHSDLRVLSADNMVVEIGPTANYGRFVELGTSRMPAQPFMTPAADAHVPAFSEAMAQLGAEVWRNGL